MQKELALIDACSGDKTSILIQSRQINTCNHMQKQLALIDACSGGTTSINTYAEVTGSK